MSWHLGIGQALRAGYLVSGLRPVLLWGCPARPLASPLRGIGPALVCPVRPPRGLPQPSAEEGGNAACRRRIASGLKRSALGLHFGYMVATWRKNKKSLLYFK